MTFDFIINGLFDKTEGIQILDFRSGSKLLLAFGADRHIGSAAHMAFFHVTTADPHGGQDRMHFFHVGFGLFRTGQFRFADNFHQRNSCPVEIDTAGIAVFLMQEFPCILLEMNSGNADLFLPLIRADFQVSTFTNRTLVLGNLVGLREIRVKVIFSGKLRISPDAAACGQSQLHCIFDHFLV